MDTKHNSRKAGQDEDIDVDHYFLPGGILDTPSQREEDMIGGSLLDEIGGVGNVALIPAKQMSVSRIVGSDARPAALEARVARVRPQSQRNATRVVGGDPTRLSVEGTNPMAKEFTPSASAIPADVAVEPTSGGSQPHAPRSVSDAPPTNRAFSAAVGSEVKNATRGPPCRSTIQRQPRKLSMPTGSAPPPQAAVQGGLGDRGQNPRHHSVEPAWAIRAAGSQQTNAGPSLPSKHRLPAPDQVMNHGHRSSPPGFPPQGGIQQRVNRVQVQELGVSPAPLQRRERVAPSKHQGGKLGQYGDGARDLRDRMQASTEGAHEFVSVPHVGRPQRRSRNQGSTRYVQSQEQCDHAVEHVKAVGGPECDRSHHEAGGKGRRRDYDPVEVKGSTRNKAQNQQPGACRVPHGRTKPLEQETPRKISSSRHGSFPEYTSRPAVDARPTSGVDDYSHRSASSSLATGPGQACVPQQLSAESSYPGKQPLPRTQDVASDEGEEARIVAGLGDHTQGRWTGNSSEENTYQVNSEDDLAGQMQLHVRNKEKDKDKARSKKKEDKIYRSAPKQLLGAAVRETSRAKLGTRLSVRQRWAGLGAYVHGFSLGLLTAGIRTIAWYLHRLRLMVRLLAVLSFAASSGVSVLNVVVSSMSWLLLLGLRVHALALKEVTGSIHVAVCFLFPYCFKYLVSAIDEWAPHWLPACLWYSFLMQMFCTSNHLFKLSISSHMVPALRALLPVAFLCEVPSGRSYLLALGGSELLLISFTLAAVRLRCLFSPIFLVSWSGQVFAIATFGSPAFLQYGQLLVSLASLHAVSTVDVMLNSRFYHARYRAGMSLTNGFRVISPPSHRMLR